MRTAATVVPRTVPAAPTTWPLTPPFAAVGGSRGRCWPRAGRKAPGKAEAAGREAGHRTGQIQPPGPHKRFVKHAGHRVAGRLEAGQPVPERLGIVQPQVLHVQDRERPGLQHVHHFAEAGRIGPGENTPLDPGVDRPERSRPMEWIKPRPCGLRQRSMTCPSSR